MDISSFDSCVPHSQVCPPNSSGVTLTKFNLAPLLSCSHQGLFVHGVSKKNKESSLNPKMTLIHIENIPTPNRSQKSHHSRLIRASSPMPHSPTPFPCFWSCTFNSAPRPPASSSSLKTTLDLLVRSLSAVDRSVFRLRIMGVRKKDLEDVECTDKESSPALEPASSRLARSAMAWSRNGCAGSDRMGDIIFSFRVLYPWILGTDVFPDMPDLTDFVSDASSSCAGAGSSTSTSSASRYHFLRLVQRPQPSWPRRPFCHYYRF